MKSIALLILTAAVSLSTIAPARQTGKQQWDFDVFLNDTKIGFHRFEVIEQQDQQFVYSKAQFNVDFLFFTAYQYEHDSFEVWQNNCLVKIKSLTNDNGELYEVSGSLVDHQFRLLKTSTPAIQNECIKSFSYWNPDFLSATRLLNPQTGEYTPVEIKRMSEARVFFNGEQLPAHKYKLAGKNLEIYLWYSHDNRWLALESVVDSSKRIRYLVPGWSV